MNKCLIKVYKTSLNAIDYDPFKDAFMDNEDEFAMSGSDYESEEEEDEIEDYESPYKTILVRRAAI